MKKIYKISKGQVITLWVFFGLLWTYITFAIIMSIVLGLGGPKPLTRIIFLLLFWFIPFVLVFYTLGWKSSRRSFVKDRQIQSTDVVKEGEHVGGNYNLKNTAKKNFLLRIYSGRLSRGQFFLTFLLLDVCATALSLFVIYVIGSMSENVSLILIELLTIIFAVLYFGLINRRLHDIGAGGLVNIILGLLTGCTGIGLFILIFLPGHMAINKYGSIPMRHNELKLLFGL